MADEKKRKEKNGKRKRNSWTFADSRRGGSANGREQTRKVLGVYTHISLPPSIHHHLSATGERDMRSYMPEVISP